MPPESTGLTTAIEPVHGTCGFGDIAQLCSQFAGFVILKLTFGVFYVIIKKLRFSDKNSFYIYTWKG